MCVRVCVRVCVCVCVCDCEDASVSQISRVEEAPKDRKPFRFAVHARARSTFLMVCTRAGACVLCLPLRLCDCVWICATVRECALCLPLRV